MISFFQSLNWFDYAIIVIILLSIGISFAHGLVQELLSLLTWILAFFIAIFFTPRLSSYLEPWFSSATLRLGLCFIALLLIVFIIGSSLKRFMSGKAKESKLSFTNRCAGAAFGAIRGGLMIALVGWAGMNLNITDLSWWQESDLIHYFDQPARWLDETFQSSVMDNIDEHAEKLEEHATENNE